MKKMILFLIGLLFFASACDKEDSKIGVYIVGSEKVYRMGNAVLLPCLVIKEQGEQDWSVIYDGIEGFDYERGYEYVISMRISTNQNPPADGSSVRRILVTVLSKTLKNSENLPPIYIDYPTQL